VIQPVSISLEIFTITDRTWVDILALIEPCALTEPWGTERIHPRIVEGVGVC